jgi:hypothetical protein
LGWSDDGQRLLVHAHDQGAKGHSSEASLSLLLVVPLDGAAPSVLAYGNDGLPGPARWSPTGPGRLVFVWDSVTRSPGMPGVYLYDVQAGLIYAGDLARQVAWSPDGSSVASIGAVAITITDREGGNDAHWKRWARAPIWPGTQPRTDGCYH